MHSKLPPPYPRLGELFRALAVALETKDRHSDVDELARKGEFDWTLLQKLADELIVAPLEKYVDPEFADMVGQSLAHVHESYLRLVSTVSLDSLSRNESLPLLINRYFCLHGLGLIYGVKKGFGGPDLTKLLDPELAPVATVLAWLDEDEAIPLVKQAYPDTTATDRNETEKHRKWCKGTDLPDRQSIIRFATALNTRSGVHESKIQNLRRWLMVARTLAHLERSSPVPFRGEMRRHLLLGMPDFDIVTVLSNAVAEAGDRLSALTMPALTLYERLKRTTPKELGEQSKIKSDLDAFECLATAVDSDGRTRFHIEWMYGRWHMLSGTFDLALQHYDAATELAHYRAGDQHKRILEEALVLAAHLRKKPMLKRIKHRAIAFGFFANPRGEVIEHWEVDQLCQQFLRLFPVQGRFPEALAQSREGHTLPFLMIAEDEIAKLRPDRRNPDRAISIHFADGQVRRWPQLRLFASFGKYSEVEQLLEAGASVNTLDDSNGSALLCAIQHATQTRDRRVLDLLLQFPHTTAVLDGVTTRKQLTPLLCAVDLGEPDVLQALLGMGATVDLRGNIIDHTPLYHAMECLGGVHNPDILYRRLYESFFAEPDFMLREVFRRYQIQIAGAFGDGATLDSLRTTSHHEDLFKQLASWMVAEHIERHSVPKLTRIIELLLAEGANPNAQHRYPAPGRTPTMLAAEINSAHAFDLLLQHGGDPYQADADGMTSVKIGTAFKAADVVSYMRKNGIV